MSKKHSTQERIRAKVVKIQAQKVRRLQRNHDESSGEQLLDRTEIQPHRYILVNKMYARDPVAYERMESEVFKAGHQVLVDAGQRSGWAVYALVSPTGSSVPYNYGTVDFVDHLSPVPMAEAMLSISACCACTPRLVSSVIVDVSSAAAASWVVAPLICPNISRRFSAM